MPLINYSMATDREVLQDLGRRLRALRETQQLTAVEAAARTGLSRRTIWRAEQGDNPTMLTLVRLMRLYGCVDAWASFLAEPEVSPMELLNQSRKRRGSRG